jgi:hypothetical protein
VAKFTARNIQLRQGARIVKRHDGEPTPKPPARDDLLDATLAPNCLKTRDLRRFPKNASKQTLLNIAVAAELSLAVRVCSGPADPG